MKILFVCAHNVGRSQMAMALYNKYSKSGHADSAGTIVGANHGQTIRERALEVQAAQNVIRVMQEEEIDVAEEPRTQIDETMLDGYDKIVVMAEDDTIPDYLRSSSKFIYWQLEDPKDKDYAGVQAAKEDIKGRVLELIRQN